MKLIYLALFALLIVVLFVGIVILCIKTPKQKNKSWVIVLAIISLIVSDTLLFATRSLPDKANELVATEVVNVETMLNNAQEGVTEHVMDPVGLQATLANSKQLLSQANTDCPVGLIVRLIGARKLTKTLEKVVGNTDDLITQFQTTNTPLTIHNVLIYTQERAQTPILSTVRALQICILVLAGVLFIVCIICYFIVRSDAMSAPQIIMGDN